MSKRPENVAVVPETAVERSERQKRARHRWGTSIGIFITSIAAVVALISMRPAPPKTPPTDNRLTVTTAPVEIGTFNALVSSQGTVQAKLRTILISESSGRIVKVSDKYAEGGIFAANEVMITIDPQDYQVAVSRAQATLAGAEARLAQELARADQAARDWQTLDKPLQAAPDLVLRYPQVAEARADVDAAKADLRKAKRDLDKTQVRSPYAGIIQERLADLGQFVSPGSQLVRLASTDIAEVRLPLKQQDQSMLVLPDPGESASIPVVLKGDYQGMAHEWNAVITRSESTIHPESRQLFVVAEIADPFSLNDQSTPLPLGTFVRAEIQGKPLDSVASIPLGLLREDGSVLLADAQNTLQVQSVEVVQIQNNVAYLKGLQPGQQLITSAVAVPVSGRELRIDHAQTSAQE